MDIRDSCPSPNGGTAVRLTNACWAVTSSTPPAPHATSSWRCTAAGSEQLVQALVALADAVLHAARDHRVPGFERVHQRRCNEAGATVAEVFEHQALEGD